MIKLGLKTLSTSLIRYPRIKFIKIKEYPQMEGLSESLQNLKFGVPEQFLHKLEAKNAFGDLLRVRYVLEHPNEFFDKVGVVAGWSKTVRF